MHLLPVETTEQNRAAQQPEVISLQHPDHETDKWPPKSA
jgi:hypothetical protein